jgi:hypothetical protein
MKHRLNIKIGLATCMLVMVTSACALMQTENERDISNQHYRIEPSVILTALAQGGPHLFSPVTERPETTPGSQRVTVAWTQEDYLLIAEALHKEVWGETLEGWKLNKMGFGLACNEVERGFQNGSFEFFRVVNRGDREVRIVHFMAIDASDKFAYTREREYDPKVRDWSVIPIGENTLTASDILEIAETNGGSEKRLSVDNACEIDLIISPHSVSFEGWLVEYTRDQEVKPFLEVEIDPATGEIIRSKERPPTTVLQQFYFRRRQRLRSMRPEKYAITPRATEERRLFRTASANGTSVAPAMLSVMRTRKAMSPAPMPSMRGHISRLSLPRLI